MCRQFCQRFGQAASHSVGGLVLMRMVAAIAEEKAGGFRGSKDREEIAGAMTPTSTQECYALVSVAVAFWRLEHWFWDTIFFKRVTLSSRFTVKQQLDPPGWHRAMYVRVKMYSRRPPRPVPEPKRAEIR